MGKRIAIYARVSTGSQSTENQCQALEEVARRAGWEIVEIYIDHGVSGTNGRKDRPAFDRLLKDASRRKLDIVGAWSVDRLGRSLQDLVSFLKEIRALGIDLYLHQQGLDTTTPAGTAMFQMLGVFSEFERALIRERVLAGLARPAQTANVSVVRACLGKNKKPLKRPCERVDTASVQSPSGAGWV